MKLCRFHAARCCQSETQVSWFEDQARVDFRSFGGQNSDFAVLLGWDDVEELIRVFAEKGNEHAIDVKRAQKLLLAVKDVKGSI